MSSYKGLINCVKQLAPKKQVQFFQEMSWWKVDFLLYHYYASNESNQGLIKHVALMNEFN